MHIAIFNVGKHKRHFSTSKLTKSLSCNHKHKTYVSTSKLTKSLSWNHRHKTYVSTSNVINSLSHTPQGYYMTRVESQADTSMTSRTGYSTQTPKKSTLFSGQYLRNHWTLDIGVLGYIGIVWPKEHSPEVWSVPPVTPRIYIYIYIYIDYLYLFSSSDSSETTLRVRHIKRRP